MAAGFGAFFQAPSAPTPLSGGVRVLQLEEFEQLDLLDAAGRSNNHIWMLKHVEAPFVEVSNIVGDKW